MLATGGLTERLAFAIRVLEGCFGEPTGISLSIAERVVPVLEPLHAYLPLRKKAKDLIKKAYPAMVTKKAHSLVKQCAEALEGAIAVAPSTEDCSHILQALLDETEHVKQMATAAMGAFFIKAQVSIDACLPLTEHVSVANFYECEDRQDADIMTAVNSTEAQASKIARAKQCSFCSNGRCVPEF